MTFIPPAQMRRILDPGIRHEWDVSLTHGATTDHRSTVDLALSQDVFGIRARWIHTPHGLEWAASAVRLPGAAWTPTRLTQAARLASQRPVVHHFARGQQRCALYLWTHRGSLKLLLDGSGVNPVSEVFLDPGTGHRVASDRITHLTTLGWQTTSASHRTPRSGTTGLDRSSRYGR